MNLWQHITGEPSKKAKRVTKREIDAQVMAKRLYKEGWRDVVDTVICQMERDGLQVPISYELHAELKRLRETPESVGEGENLAPRWIMTKCQSVDRLNDAFFSERSAWKGFMDRWGVGIDEAATTIVSPHDCPGMKENGPVIWVADARIRGSGAAAARLAKEGDFCYWECNESWSRYSGVSWWSCEDPGLL